MASCGLNIDRRGTRRGIVAPAVAIMLLGLVGIAAIAIDGGMLLSDRRSLQATADAAAVAAAVDLFNNYATYAGVDTPGTAAKSAQGVATDNGFSNGKNGVTVTVNIPPASGTFKGTNGYAEVIINENQNRFFSRIFGSGTVPVQARAVARGVIGNSGVGILALDPSAPSSLTLAGNATIQVTGSVMVNSSDSSAATGKGSGVLASNSQFDVVGNYTNGGNSAFTAPTIKTGATAATDPLNWVPTPDPSSMSLQSTSSLHVTSTQTLSPGVYQGGIQISSANVTLSPGIYYIQGGGFAMSGSSSSLTGSGVMIYNGPDSSGSAGSVGTVNISGGTAVLSPPATGTYQGITIFQNRGATAAISMSGGSGWNVTGTVYAASAAAAISGQGGATIGSQYIVDTLSLTGQGSMGGIDPSKAAGQRLLGLVE